jgi:glycosyltransferase 2 family protein
MSRASALKAATLLSKVALFVAVIAYLFRSESLDLVHLGRTLSDPSGLVVSCALFALVTFLLCYRWQKLIGAVGLSAPIGRLGVILMLSGFFTMLFVGSATGDLVKAAYLVGDHPERKSRALLSIVADRLVSIVALFMFTSLALTLRGRSPEMGTGLRVIIDSVSFVSIALILGLLSLALSSRATPPAFLARTKWFQPISELLKAVGHRWRTLIFSFLVSGGALFLTVLIYYFEGRRVGVPLAFLDYFFVIPVSLVASYLSILPFGIGVGQVAFQELFKWMGASSRDGFTLATAIQSYSIVFHGLGGLVILGMGWNRFGNRRPVADA